MIKKKIFLLSLLVFLLYSLSMLVIQNESMKSLLSHEVKEDGLRSLKTGIGIIKNELNALENVTVDYANWDDTYTFVETKDKEFMKSSLNKEALINLELEGIFIYDVKKRLVHSETVLGSNNSQKSNIKSEDFSFITNIEIGKTGFFKANQVVYMFSAQPIKDSTGTKPSKGIIIFVRSSEKYLEKKMAPWFDEPPLFVEKCVEHATSYGTEVGLFSNMIAPSEYLQSIDGVVYVDDTHPTQLGLYFDIKGIDGSTVTCLSIMQSKKIIFEGWQLLLKVILITMLTGVFVAFLFGSLFNVSFVKPLEVLRYNMNFFNESPTGVSMDTLDGNIKRKDELGDLTRGFIEMKKSIVDAYEYLKNVNSLLEEKVNERTHELLMANNELLLSEAIIRGSSEGILICDANTTIIRVNEAFCKISGFSEDELVGKNPRVMKSNRHGESFYKNMWDKIIREGNWSGEIWDRKKNGEVYPKWLSISVIKNQDGSVSHYTSISSDISVMKEAEEQLKTMAFYDSLTGLPNRFLFYDRLQQSLKNVERYDSKFAVYFMDLDGFKLINDTWGHNVGDELLIEVSRRLLATVRESDTVSRLGGDEFTIILQTVHNEPNLKDIADKIIKAIEQPYLIRDIEMSVSISIGIAVVPNDAKTMELVIKKADSAMYISKSKGKGCYSFASEALLSGEIMMF